MRANNKSLFLFLITTFATGFYATAQKSTRENSPYNRFGIGTLLDSKLINTRGMGGAATAYNDPFAVNSFNPATYSFLKSTTLDVGIEGRSTNILMNDQSTHTGTGTFSYFNLGIPMKQYAGLNIGFAPISSSYYHQSDTTDVAGIGRMASNYDGTGSLQYAYIGLAGKYKGLSIGVNFGYAFGNNTQTSSLGSVDSTLAGIRTSSYQTHTSIGGIYWKGGILYNATIKKDNYLNIGATATLSQSLTGKRDQYSIAQSYWLDPSTLIADSAIDTVSSMTDAKGKIVLPAEYSFGVHYGKAMYWDVGADLVYDNWSNFRNFGNKDSVADNAWRVSVGGEVTPNPLAHKGYLSVATYRLGLYYGNDYIDMRNKQLSYWGATVGASFPFFKSRGTNQYAKLNTALDIGRRGTTDNGLAREFYVRFSIGISFNDIWFIKRTLD